MKVIRNGLLFAHVPKTAGTSFRKSAEDHARGWTVYSDYGADNPVTSDLIKALYEAGSFDGLVDIDNDKGRTMVSGHFMVKKYLPYYPITSVITFLRDPVQRVISHYHDLQERISYAHSLEEFVTDSKYQNLQSRYFKDIQIQALGLVGISEFYSEGLEQLKKRYGLNLPVKYMNRNTRKQADFYTTTGRIAALIKKHNPQDVRLYNTALKQFLLRQALARSGKPYTHGRLNRVEENRISGWAFEPENPAPVTLEIYINGKKEAEILADQPRPGLARQNYPREGQVGFAFQPQKVLGSTDVVEVQVAHTGQLITRD